MGGSRRGGGWQGPVPSRSRLCCFSLATAWSPRSVPSSAGRPRGAAGRAATGTAAPGASTPRSPGTESCCAEGSGHGLQRGFSLSFGNPGWVCFSWHTHVCWGRTIKQGPTPAGWRCKMGALGLGAVLLQAYAVHHIFRGQVYCPVPM